MSFESLLEPFHSTLKELGVEETSHPTLLRYLDHLWRRNQDLNLVSRKMEPERLISDHLMDSLIGLPSLPQVDRIADLGTGGGFPAIPLAACRPDTTFVLFEKSPLKRGFLWELTDIVDNLEVAGPLDAAKLRDVDLIIARAFKPIAVILEMTRGYYERGRPYMLFKARLGKIQEELEEAGIPEKAWRIEPLQTIGDIEERHLVHIRKP